LGFGANVVLTWPVKALKANTFRRVMSVELFALRTRLNSPPTITMSPTRVIE
jgi:hypothetical protein